MYVCFCAVVKSLMAYLDSLQPHFDHVLAFEPTGWTYSNKTLSVENIRPRYTSSRVTIYGMFLLARHSSNMPYCQYSEVTMMVIELCSCWPSFAVFCILGS